MKLYSFEIGCPKCGGDLTHQAGGAPSDLLTQSVAACTTCVCEYIVRVSLTPVGVTRPSRHQPHPVTATILSATNPGVNRTWAR